MLWSDLRVRSFKMQSITLFALVVLASSAFAYLGTCERVRATGVGLYLTAPALLCLTQMYPSPHVGVDVSEPVR